jgi:hypothetical protein
MTGCAGYRLGPTNGVQAGEKTIRVLPFANHTIQPRLTDEVTQQIRKQLQRDSTYKLSSRQNADIIVTGQITDYRRSELSFAPDDILTVRDFRIILTANVQVRNTATGELILNEDVRGATLVRIGTDLLSAERQALPLLAADLAQNITTLIVDGNW